MLSRNESTSAKSSNCSIVKAGIYSLAGAHSKLSRACVLRMELQVLQNERSRSLITSCYSQVWRFIRALTLLFYNNSDTANL